MSERQPRRNDPNLADLPDHWKVPEPGLGTCLGIGEPEHSFLSPDPLRVRVCERCRALGDRYVNPDTYGDLDR